MASANSIGRSITSNRQSEGGNMITVRELLMNDCSTSPDGEHWEPLLYTQSNHWRSRIHDAVAVLKGDAIAVRQTIKEDIAKTKEEE